MQASRFLFAAVFIVVCASDVLASSLREQARDLAFMATQGGAPVCLVENGYDYVGYDLFNAPGGVDQCCNICGSTPGCHAWSWSGHNGGTCWFKSGRGDIILNPNVKSALNPKSSSSYCQLKTDLDYVGNDLTRVDGAKAEDCCDHCQKYAGCRAYSWSSYRGGSCWLKSEAGHPVYRPGVKSAKAYPELTSSCSSSLEYGIDYVNNDIGNKPGASAGACCDVCKGTPGCRAYSWSNHNGGTCWLKNLKGNSIYKPGVTSSQVYPNPDPKCTLKSDTDYMDNDMDYVPSTDPLLCCSICRERSGCKAVAWSDFDGGMCWLKSAVGVSITKSGVKATAI